MENEEFNLNDESGGKLSVHELQKTLEILVARSAQTSLMLTRPFNVEDLGQHLYEIYKNQIALMGSSAALIVNVIEVKNSFGES